MYIHHSQGIRSFLTLTLTLKTPYFQDILSLLTLILKTPYFQGILSFLSAPLVGALSDVWGRKSWLLVTVFCTCLPIPLLKISAW